MTNSNYRRSERRGSTRVTLAVPLRVDGEDMTGESFTVKTHTLSLSQNGCLMALERKVVLEQSLVVMNEHTRKSAMCRVVSARKHRDGKVYVGAAFVSPQPDFWGIVFSPPGAKSLKRQYGSKEAP